MNITESGNDSSLNWTVNGTIYLEREPVYQVSTALQVTNVGITILTVVFNCTIIGCLLKNRPKIPVVIFHQLMSLSISDVIAGLTPATSCLTLIESVNRSSIACATLLVSYTAAQYAVLLNLCVLSFRRWLVLRKADQPTTRTNQSLLRTTLFTLCPWLVSGLLTVAVVYMVVTENPSVNGCLSTGLVENTAEIVPITLTYFGTLLLLNVFNGLSAIALKRLNAMNTTGTSNHRQEAQQRAFRHLVAVLMVANVTTLPSVIFDVTSIVKGEVDGAVMLSIGTVQTLNSLINPILYSAHINEIRDAIKSIVMSLLQRNRNATTGVEIGGNPGIDGAVYVTPTKNWNQG